MKFVFILFRKFGLISSSLSYLPNPFARVRYDTTSIFKFNRFDFRVFLLLD